MKPIAILFGIFLLLVTGLYFAPLMVNWANYKTVMINTFKLSTGRDVEIKGGVTGTFLPFPSIILTDVRISNSEGSSTDTMVKAKRLKVYPAFFSLLQGKLRVGAITLESASLQLEVLENGKGNWEFNSSTKAGEGGGLPENITLVDTELVLRKNASQFIKVFQGVNASLQMDSMNGPFDIEGRLLHEGMKTRFSAHLGKIIPDKSPEVSWEINAKGAKLSFKGKMSDHNKEAQTVVEGKFTAAITSLKDFSQQFLLFSPAVYSKVHETLNVSGNLSFSEEDILLDNMSISSPNAKGEGHVKVSFDATPVVDIILAFDTINIDGLTALPKNAKKDDFRNSSYDRKVRNNKFSFPKNVNALLYLTAKKVIYNDRSIENIVLNTDLFNGGMEIYPSTAQLPDNARMEVWGSISSNGVRPAFEGHLVASGDSLANLLDWAKLDKSFFPVGKLANFDVKTQLNISPKEVRLSDMDITVDDLNVNGLFNVRHGGGIPEINTNITLSALDLDSPVISSKISEFLEPFMSRAADAASDFQWLRRLPIRIGAEVSVSELKYNQRTFKSPLIVFHLVPGAFSCDKLVVDSELASFNADALLDIRALYSKINLNIKGKSLDMAIFSPPHLPVKEPSAEVAAVLAANNNNLSSPVVPGKKTKWSTESLRFPRVDKFSGNIKLLLDSLTYGGLKVSNLNIAARMADGILAIDTLKGDVFEGKLLAKGGIGATPPSVSMSFSFANGLLAPFLKTFSNADSLSGYFSLSGSFTTQGTSPSDWAEGMQMGVSVAVREMTMENIDLDKLVGIANHTGLTEEQFSTLVHDSTTQGKTLFYNVDGKLAAMKGIMQVQGVAFDTARTSGAMSGSVDLKNWIMNMASKIAFIPRIGEQPLSIEATLTGPIDTPDRRFDVKLLENYVVTSMPDPAPAPVAGDGAGNNSNASSPPDANGNSSTIDPNWGENTPQQQQPANSDPSANNGAAGGKTPSVGNTLSNSLSIPAPVPAANGNTMSQQPAVDNIRGVPSY